MKPLQNQKIGCSLGDFPAALLRESLFPLAGAGALLLGDKASFLRGCRWGLPVGAAIGAYRGFQPAYRQEMRVQMVRLPSQTWSVKKIALLPLLYGLGRFGFKRLSSSYAGFMSAYLAIRVLSPLLLFWGDAKGDLEREKGQKVWEEALLACDLTWSEVLLKYPPPEEIFRRLVSNWRGGVVKLEILNGGGFKVGDLGSSAEENYNQLNKIYRRWELVYHPDKRVWEAPEGLDALVLTTPQQFETSLYDLAVEQGANAEKIPASWKGLSFQQVIQLEGVWMAWKEQAVVSTETPINTIIRRCQGVEEHYVSEIRNLKGLTESFYLHFVQQSGATN